MVAASPAPLGDGADGRHLVPSGRGRLVGRLLERAAQRTSLFHARADPCVAGAEARPVLPAADASPLLPLCLSAGAWKALLALWHRATGANHPRPLSRRPRSARRDRPPKSAAPVRVTGSRLSIAAPRGYD